MAPSCRKQAAVIPVHTGGDSLINNPSSEIAHSGSAFTQYVNFPESFESGLKDSYADAGVELSTGQWQFENALIGRTDADRKTGNASVRMAGNGRITMNFDLINGASEVKISHALFGNDTAAAWELWYSTSAGALWAQTGGRVVTTSASIATVTFPVNIAGAVRFQIRKISGTRINIDDFSIANYTDSTSAIDTIGGPATRDDNLGMGYPSAAGFTDFNDYLMIKAQYALSYNNSKGMANWVSWHLSPAWKGSATRCDCFTSDATLPSACYKVTTGKYTNTGFDRGHLCPSDDRDGSSMDNSATFLMTNIAPQSPVLNQQTWGDLEDYCRSLAASGNELYIIAGAYGQGGNGSGGGTSSTIAGGSIMVPAHYWKVIVVLPIGKKDAGRVSATTRVIAVDMPNQQSVNAHNWAYYRTSIDAIEAATGYDFLTSVPVAVQSGIEARTDAGPTH